MFCPRTEPLGKVCLHKETFQFLGRSGYRCVQSASVWQVRRILFEDQTNSFFLSFGQGVCNFEERPKSIQVVFEDTYSRGKCCFKREKCETLDGYVAAPKSIYGCGKCGAWLFVHKVPFTLQEHRKTTITDKTRFSLLKMMNLLPQKLSFNNVSFELAKHGRIKRFLCGQ